MNTGSKNSTSIKFMNFIDILQLYIYLLKYILIKILKFQPELTFNMKIFVIGSNSFMGISLIRYIYNKNFSMLILLA